jgi:hypothetical protein
LFGDHLQRLRLPDAGGARDQPVPVDGRQRDAHLGRGVTGPVDDDGAQFQRLAVNGVTCGDPLGWVAVDSVAMGRPLLGDHPRAVGAAAGCRLTAYCERCA